MAELSDFLALPLFEGFSTDTLGNFLKRFERRTFDEGHVLFKEGDSATHIGLLLSGTIKVSDETGDRMVLHAPAVIGELGALTALRRHRTATVVSAASLLRASREDLITALSELPEAAFLFHQNLLAVVSDKVDRDEQRLADMRANIVRTQKAMKSLREHVLAELETTISESVHDTLDELISQNRRVNYSVKPPRSMPAFLRWNDGSTQPVLSLSRTTLKLSEGSGLSEGDASHGVLVLPDGELPVDGTVSCVGSGQIDFELEPLIEDYGVLFEDYLTRVQTLDVLF